MVELVGAGRLEPTAQQVAERAEVGVRTVFRHFSDMETLYATMNERLTDRIAHLFAERAPEGPLSERIRGVASRRARIYVEIEPYRRARSSTDIARPSSRKSTTR